MIDLGKLINQLDETIETLNAKLAEAQETIVQWEETSKDDQNDLKTMATANQRLRAELERVRRSAGDVYRLIKSARKTDREAALSMLRKIINTPQGALAEAKTKADERGES